jgi:hypothetical protein
MVLQILPEREEEKAITKMLNTTVNLFFTW